MGVGIYIWGVPHGTPLLFTNMRKLFTYILAVAAFFVISARVAYGKEISVSQSGAIRSRVEAESFDYRTENLRRFLQKHGSPLAPFSQDFVTYADIYGLDYRLVPSISGVESTFGKQIPFNSYNAYGWANGNHAFKSWPESIDTVSKTLRFKYIDRGAVSVAQIARRYAPPSSSWGGKVKYFESKIDTLPLTFDI